MTDKTHNTDHHDTHEIKYAPYWYVWLALLGFTWLTIWSAGQHFGNLTTLIALSIATVKVSLVMAIFMHLYHEKKLFTVLLLICISILLMYIGLTFVDTSLR